MASEAHDDLSWQAFRYLAGELTGAELGAFERLLDDDQTAREALAGAVELAGAVALVGPSLEAERAGRAGRRWLALVTSLAACLALAIGWRAWPTQPPNPGPAAVRPATGAVALAWSGLRREVEEPEDTPSWLDEPPAVVEPEVEGALPSWLLEAAALGAAPGREG